MGSGDALRASMLLITNPGRLIGMRGVLARRDMG
jgi:hypothetical protein